ncbi:MAG: hypothetical protein KJO38_06425, partial [Gammaproteobacteria bacterium]|nr:hypothetical protein [Gammaproteobacteria bacterium]
MIGIAALLGTTLAQAVHLGDLRTSSALGEPYAAFIPLYAPAPDELAGTVVDVIADPLLGRQAGMRRVLDSISGEVVEDASGAYIAIRSSVVVNEPILAFRVQLSNGSRFVSRAYSAIIDPRPARVAARGRTVTPAAVTAGSASSPGSYG